MSSKKVAAPNSPWIKIETESQAARRNVEQLARDIESLVKLEVRDPVAGAAILAGEIRAWSTSAESARHTATRALHQLEEERKEYVEYLEDRLIRALTSRGHSVFGDTTPIVVDGVVYLELDKEKPSVLINSEPVGAFGIDILAGMVAERIAWMRKAATPPQTLLAQLADAYQRELRLSGKARSTPVVIASLLPHLMLARQTAAFRSNPTARTFREYSRDQFRADLHALMVSGATDVEGGRFRYASGSDTAGAIFMFVPALNRTAHVGRVWFDPA